MRVVLIFSFNCQQESDKAYCVSHRVKLMLGILHRWTHMAQVTRAKNVTKGNVKKRSALVPFLHLTAFLCLLCDFAWMDCRFVSLLNQSRSGYCISHPMEDWMPLLTEACKAVLAAAAPFLYLSLPFLCHSLLFRPDGGLSPNTSWPSQWLSLLCQESNHTEPVRWHTRDKLNHSLSTLKQ